MEKEQHKSMVSFLSSLSEHNGEWEEINISSLKAMIETFWNPELIKGSYVSKIIPMDNDRFLIHWNDRFRPLTDEEYTVKYGKIVNIENLRNKLGPFKNLIAMLENGLAEGTIDVHQLVLDEIRVCKENMSDLLQFK
jgi:hypothetical protein